MRSSNFRYYIHDSNASLRLELIGNLNAGDIPELQGCWITARTTLGGRDLVIDVKALEQRDEAGVEWLREMTAEGAVILERVDSTKVRQPKTAFAGKLSQSPTQAQ